MAFKVSTIIPAFNAEQTIAKAIDSALSQEYESHEVVVVNDGSTDSTAVVLSRYGNRIRVLNQTNRGAGLARNTGVAQSSGAYLAFLDSDDLWMPGKLHKMVAALERNPLASLAFSDYRFIADDGTVCGGSSFGEAPGIERLLTELPLPVHSFPAGIVTSTWVVPRHRFERSGGFSEAFKGGQGFEDSWLLVLLRDLGEFQVVSANLTCYRVPGSGESADKYGHALSTFRSLVRDRYGPQGRALIRSANNLQCRWLLSKTAHQMNIGDRSGAIRSLARIARLRPAYFLSAELTSRLLLPQNMKRFRDLTSMLSRRVC